MKEKTKLTTHLEQTSEKKLYDASCKRLLSNKMILAYILQGTVKEFEDAKIKDIANTYIEGQTDVSSISVLTGENIRGDVTENIRGDVTESIGMNEGKISYDIRFRATAPKEVGHIDLMLNVEAQNQYNPGYPLTKRAVYYASRMISGQYGKEFTHGAYDKLKPVYSIWICTNVPKHLKNSIRRYSLKEEHLVGHAKEPKKNYDLINIVFICLGEPEDQQPSELLNLLNTLLSSNVKADKKIAILEEEFEIPRAIELEEEVYQMCNLSDGVEMRGIEKGIEKGIARGRELGHQEGRELGHQEGLQLGRELERKKIQEVLKNALQMNMPLQDVSRLTNTPMAELEALTAQLNVA